jgi:hypothetical protein
MEQIISNKKTGTARADKTRKKNYFLRPTYCGSIRTDLPLTVIGKKQRKLIEMIGTGQLFCVGKVYLKTHSGIIRIR